MVNLPIKSDLINDITSRILAIRPKITIDYEFGYNGIAFIFLENDFKNDTHRLHIKGRFVDEKSIIHELLHILYGYENKIDWLETFTDTLIMLNARCTFVSLQCEIIIEFIITWLQMG